MPAAAKAVISNRLGALAGGELDVGGLAAIADTRPTLTDEMVAEFEEDIAERTRL
jgi:hypothetical protein